MSGMLCEVDLEEGKMKVSNVFELIVCRSISSWVAPSGQMTSVA
jgi:hypothetical protein